MSDSEEDFQLNINEDFAKTYEKRKRDEDITKIRDQFKGQEVPEDKLEKILERKRKYGIDKPFDEEEGLKVFVDEEDGDDESEEEEDEKGDLVTKEVDSQLLRTLVLLKTKNSDIYDSEKKFFDDKAIQEAKERLKAKKLAKQDEPITLRKLKQDKLSKGILDDEEEEREEMENAKLNKPSKLLSHEEEQAMLKNELKSAISKEIDEDSDEDFFSKRKKTDDDEKAEEEDYKNFLLEEMAKADATKNVYQQWSSYKDNPKVSKDDAFLMDYILNRGWIDKEAEKVPTYAEVVGEIDSEEEIDRADSFELNYNFRYEEPGSHQIQSFPRNIQGTVRKSASKRKERRERQKERRKAEKVTANEDVKRTKNTKMAEIMATLGELEKITGNKVTVDDLEGELDGEFDPNNFDAQFNAKFTDKFYDDEGSDNEKPVFDDEIEVDDLEAQQTPEEAEKIKQAAMKLMGEYYKLNYEDKIEDLATRFKYRKVEKASGGLEVMDILLADDKDLNQVVPLRSLAPYKEGSEKVKVRKDKVKELRRKLVQDGKVEKEFFKSQKENSEDKDSSKKRKSDKEESSDLKKTKSSKVDETIEEPIDKKKKKEKKEKEKEKKDKKKKKKDD